MNVYEILVESWMATISVYSCRIRCSYGGGYEEHVTVFWYVALCSLVAVYLRFGGVYCLHLHGKIATERAQLTNCFCLVSSSAPPKRREVTVNTAPDMKENVWESVLEVQHINFLYEVSLLLEDKRFWTEW
jgi:hypothetical protein